MGVVLELKPRQIESAIDRDTFLNMILSEQKRKEVSKRFEEKSYDVEQFFVRPTFLEDEEDE